MRSETLKPKKIKIVFYSVALLLTAQVVWWATTFLSHVDELSLYKKRAQENASPEARLVIDRETFHKRVMFLSESAFFLLATGTGIFLLYRALRVEESARSAQKSFVEIMSHESKTPITALKLRLESVWDKRQQDEELVREMKSSLLEVRRLSSLFDKAMSLSRADRTDFQTEVISLSEMVTSVVSRMDPVLRERQVALSLDMDDSIHVRGDLGALQSSVQSLIENSVYYNDHAEKRVHVSLERKGNKAFLVVEDNGPGISPEEKEKVFEKFYRGSHHHGVPGSGLGLYLARKMVESHHGTLQLHTSSMGGVRFDVELPEAEAA